MLKHEWVHVVTSSTADGLNHQINQALKAIYTHHPKTEIRDVQLSSFINPTEMRGTPHLVAIIRYALEVQEVPNEK